MNQNRTGTALVTGASSGIGREIARILASRGHDLVLVSRSAPKLDELKRELEASYGISAMVLPMDLSRPGAAVSVHEILKARDIEIDILVNNAGVGYYGEVVSMPADRIEGLVMLDVVALTQLCSLFGADMKARKRGRILNVSSAAAFLPVPYAAVYSAAKSYVTKFSRAFREEMRPYGVIVTCLHPGQTRTGFFEAAGGRTVNTLMTMSAREVAESGVRAVFRGKASITTGTMNKISSLAGLVVPVKLIGWFMRRSIGRK